MNLNEPPFSSKWKQSFSFFHQIESSLKRVQEKPSVIKANPLHKKAFSSVSMRLYGGGGGRSWTSWTLDASRRI